MHWQRNLLVLGSAAIGVAVLAMYWRTAADRPEPAPVAAEAEPAPMSEPFVTVVDPAKGPKDARVVIVEFGDHVCPYCRSSQQAIERLLAEHPSDVRLVWKSVPSSLHPGSDSAAQAALCAGRQGRFWEYHARLFEDPGPFDQLSLAVIADGLGLDAASFNDCLAQDATLPLVQRTIDEARALGLTAIPTLFIGGKRHEGAMTYEQLLEATGL